MVTTSMSELSAATLVGAGQVPLRAGDETDWISAHVFYHGDQTELLVNVIVPMMREAAGEGLVAGWFFLRYWEGGPHVRLRVLPARAPAAAGAVVAADRRLDVQARIRDHLGHHLGARPSADVLSQAEYTRMAPLFAATERLTDYAEQLYPNNSVVFLPYRRERDRYGDGASVEAVERHFTVSSQIAAGLLASPRWTAQRETIGFSLILLTWLCGQPDLGRLAGYSGGTYRVLSSAFSGVAGDLAAEADLQDRYHRQRDQLRGLGNGLRRLAGRLRKGDAGPTALTEWGRTILTLGEELATEVALGRFAPPPVGGDRQTTGAGDDVPARVLPVLDICAHLVCNRLGIEPPEEFYLRYLAARVVGALTGEAG
jgi:Lantibiotic biosynthesis dehydratase C-term